MAEPLIQSKFQGKKRLLTLEFWRNQFVAFAVFSMVGHWVEIPYCLFNLHVFGIVDPNSGVFSDPLEPFCVYGFAIIACNILLVPVRQLLEEKFKNRKWIGVVLFFLLATIVAMDGELIQGFLQNMPDENGVYPLWDNSKLPFNVAGQAWLVNDVLLGLIITVYLWVIEPPMVNLMNTSTQWKVEVVSAVIIIAFAILCLIKFVIFPVH